MPVPETVDLHQSEAPFAVSSQPKSPELVEQSLVSSAYVTREVGTKRCRKRERIELLCRWLLMANNDGNQDNNNH